MLRRLAPRAPMGHNAAALRLAALRWASITEVKMPALSPTMTSGKLDAWKINVGEEVLPANVYCSVGTDKATLSFENVADEGFMARHVVPAGTDNVEVGTTIALLVDEAADVSSDDVKNWKPAASATPAAPAAPTPAPAATPASAAKASAKAGSGDLGRSGPAAHRLAAVLSPAELGKVTPTGKDGRFAKSDFAAAFPDIESRPAKPLPPLAAAVPAAKASAAASTYASSATSLATPVVNFSVRDGPLLRRLMAGRPAPLKKKVAAEA
jgi:pyruvate dehydrogenase E2 component (dihydrolipoamide acetyltransferase)